MSEANERKIVLIYTFCYHKCLFKVGSTPCYIYYSGCITAKTSSFLPRYPANILFPSQHSATQPIPSYPAQTLLPSQYPVTQPKPSYPVNTQLLSQHSVIQPKPV